MKLRILLIVLVIFLLPIPLGLFLGLFMDYSEASNQRYLRYHPGYYYHYWSSPRSTSGIAVSRTTFRGGGPAFGK